MNLPGLAFLSAVLRRDFKQYAIVQHITERGGRVVRIRRTPFAEVWFGNTRDPIFDVTYRDKQGVERQTTCKVSTSGSLSWLDQARDPRAMQKQVRLTTKRNGLPQELSCSFCHAKVLPGAKRCRVCRVPFIGT